MATGIERESMEFDVVIVGAGPAGLSAACRLMQLSCDRNREISVCVLEKGSEIGAHIVSGAVFDPRALDELFPNWADLEAPLITAVTRDELYFLRNQIKAIKVPARLVPRPMRNEGNYIISLANLCRWLAKQAEQLGVNLFTGFSAADIKISDGCVEGVITGDMGLDRNGNPKGTFQPGIELQAKYTIFSEGCRGHLGKRLIRRYKLNKEADPQHFAIGIKEIWNIDPQLHKAGLVVHTLGWPLDDHTGGGGFLYHMGNNQVSLGFVVALDYSNPYLDPFEEMQRWKTHPQIKRYLQGGVRVGYSARALNKGGLQAVPKLCFPGGLLAGCDAGFLNAAKIKGSHTAMKSGMLAAEAVFEALTGTGEDKPETVNMDENYKSSWIYDELYRSRNFTPALKKFGTIFGAGFIWFEQNVLLGHSPITLHALESDHACLKEADKCPKIDYPKPDGVLTFDRLSSVYLSGTNHDEDQPCHLKLADPKIPIEKSLPLYQEPAQRYCPAGVYEIVSDISSGARRLQINSQNCVHCKVCDIKDPYQNITWIAPEGGGGPNYSNM